MQGLVARAGAAAVISVDPYLGMQATNFEG